MVKKWVLYFVFFCIHFVFCILIFWNLYFHLYLCCISFAFILYIFCILQKKQKNKKNTTWKYNYVVVFFVFLCCIFFVFLFFVFFIFLVYLLFCILFFLRCVSLCRCIVLPNLNILCIDTSGNWLTGLRLQVPIFWFVGKLCWFAKTKDSKATSNPQSVPVIFTCLQPQGWWSVLGPRPIKT